MGVFLLTTVSADCHQIVNLTLEAAKRGGRLGLVLDGDALLYYLLHLGQVFFGSSFWMSGGQYNMMNYVTRKLVDNFREAKVDIHVVFDGPVTSFEKENENISRRSREVGNVARVWDHLHQNSNKVEMPATPYLAKIEMYCTLKELGVPTFVAISEADRDLAYYARTMYIFFHILVPVSQIPLDPIFMLLSHRRFVPSSDFSKKWVEDGIEAQVFAPKMIARKYGFHVDLLPLFACFLGNDYTRSFVHQLQQGLGSGNLRGDGIQMVSLVTRWLAQHSPTPLDNSIPMTAAEIHRIVSEAAALGLPEHHETYMYLLFASISQYKLPNHHKGIPILSYYEATQVKSKESQCTPPSGSEVATRPQQNEKLTDTATPPPASKEVSQRILHLEGRDLVWEEELFDEAVPLPELEVNPYHIKDHTIPYQMNLPKEVACFQRVFTRVLMHDTILQSPWDVTQPLRRRLYGLLLKDESIAVKEYMQRFSEYRLFLAKPIPPFMGLKVEDLVKLPENDILRAKALWHILGLRAEDFPTTAPPCPNSPDRAWKLIAWCILWFVANMYPPLLAEWEFDTLLVMLFYVRRYPDLEHPQKETYDCSVDFGRGAPNKAESEVAIPTAIPPFPQKEADPFRRTEAQSAHQTGPLPTRQQREAQVPGWVQIITRPSSNSSTPRRIPAPPPAARSPPVAETTPRTPSQPLDSGELQRRVDLLLGAGTEKSSSTFQRRRPRIQPEAPAPGTEAAGSGRRGRPHRLATGSTRPGALFVGAIRTPPAVGYFTPSGDWEWENTRGPSSAWRWAWGDGWEAVAQPCDSQAADSNNGPANSSEAQNSPSQEKPKGEPTSYLKDIEGDTYEERKFDVKAEEEEEEEEEEEDHHEDSDGNDVTASIHVADDTDEDEDDDSEDSEEEQEDEDKSGEEEEEDDQSSEGEDEGEPEPREKEAEKGSQEAVGSKGEKLPGNEEGIDVVSAALNKSEAILEETTSETFTGDRGEEFSLPTNSVLPLEWHLHNTTNKGNSESKENTSEPSTMTPDAKGTTTSVPEVTAAVSISTPIPSSDIQAVPTAIEPQEKVQTLSKDALPETPSKLTAATATETATATAAVATTTAAAATTSTATEQTQVTSPSSSAVESSSPCKPKGKIAIRIRKTPSTPESPATHSASSALSTLPAAVESVLNPADAPIDDYELHEMLCESLSHVLSARAIQINNIIQVLLDLVCESVQLCWAPLVVPMPAPHLLVNGHLWQRIYQICMRRVQKKQPMPVLPQEALDMRAEVLKCITGLEWWNGSCMSRELPAQAYTIDQENRQKQMEAEAQEYQASLQNQNPATPASTTTQPTPQSSTSTPIKAIPTTSPATPATPIAPQTTVTPTIPSTPTAQTPAAPTTTTESSVTTVESPSKSTPKSARRPAKATATATTSPSPTKTKATASSTTTTTPSKITSPTKSTPSKTAATTSPSPTKARSPYKGGIGIAVSRADLSPSPPRSRGRGITFDAVGRPIGLDKFTKKLSAKRF
ncbi:hypothetical protein Pelo_5006 [Pelomyxa schiedti]|nr:hypothetical protein Pelo_5006 [Pelomyxa schiedti]